MHQRLIEVVPSNNSRIKTHLEQKSASSRSSARPSTFQCLGDATSFVRRWADHVAAPGGTSTPPRTGHGALTERASSGSSVLLEDSPASFHRQASSRTWRKSSAWKRWPEQWNMNKPAWWWTLPLTGNNVQPGQRQTLRGEVQAAELTSPVTESLSITSNASPLRFMPSRASMGRLKPTWWTRSTSEVASADPKTFVAVAAGRCLAVDRGVVGVVLVSWLFPSGNSSVDHRIPAAHRSAMWFPAGTETVCSRDESPTNHFKTMHPHSYG